MEGREARDKQAASHPTHEQEDVTSLDFSRSGITAVRMMLLAGILKCNTTLESLDLYKQLNAETSKVLAQPSPSPSP